MEYVSYPWNADFDELPNEYEKILFTRQPIDYLTDNIVERLKVSLIGQFFDNIIYESNHQNSNLDELSFDGGERLITRQRIYRINDYILFILNNGSIDDV